MKLPKLPGVETVGMRGKRPLRIGDRVVIYNSRLDGRPYAEGIGIIMSDAVDGVAFWYRVKFEGKGPALHKRFAFEEYRVKDAQLTYNENGDPVKTGGEDARSRESYRGHEIAWIRGSGSYAIYDVSGKYRTWTRTLERARASIDRMLARKAAS